MRSTVLLLATALFAAPVVAADLPAVVIRVKPLGSLLEDVRTGARHIGGDFAVKKVDEALKEGLGEKGFDGVDLTKPILGYVNLKGKVEKAEETPLVFAVPVTGEKAFLGLMERTGNKVEAVAGKAGLYRNTPPKRDAEAEPTAQYFRFADNYVYVAQADAAALDASALITAAKLEMPEEKALVTVRVYFERLPEDTRKQMTDALDKALADLKNAPIPPDAEEAVKAFTAKVQSEAARVINLLRQGDEGVFRFVFDAPTGEIGLEFGLAGKPGTELAKLIAGHKPSPHRFAGLLTKETAAGVIASAPLLSKDLGDAFATAFEEAAKKDPPEDLPPFAKPALAEVVKGLARTFRSGTLDWALAVNGPDREGKFTAVAAMSFEDPAALEKELRTLVKEQAPPDLKEAIQFDAAKVGDIFIHKLKLSGQLPPEAQKVFGENANLVVAFAPKGIYLALGADPVPALKAALAAAPAEARAFDLILNPARVQKLAALAGGEMAAAQAAELLGTADERTSALFVSLDGGRELRLRIGVNLKLIGGAAFRSTMQHGGEPK